MIPYLGDFVEDDVVYLMFNTFSSDDPSASVTITNFINTDVHIHKDDSTTQRNNAAGITVSVNFDGITGSHMIKIDTNDNTVAGFWVTGHDYFVRIEGTTIDGATINAVVGHFSIQNRFMRGTNSAALATGVNVTQISGDTTAANNLESYCDGTTPQPVNITQLGGVAQSLTDLKDFADAGYDPGANKITGCKVNDDMVGAAPTVGEIRTEMEGAGSKLLAIETDTNELQTDWKDTGRLDLILDIIAADTTTDIPALIAALNDISAANVNEQVVDVLKTDTIAEPAQGAPPATPTFEEALMYVYFKLRNKSETTATEDAMYDDAGTTKLMKAAVSDNGTTFTKAEYVSGV